MADPAHIEAIQAQKAAEARHATHIQAVRQLLAAYDPQPGDASLDYRGLLQRAENVIATALQEQEGGEWNPTTPPWKPS